MSCTPFAATSRAAKPFRYVDKLTPGEGYYRLVLVTENDMVQELAQTTIPTPSGAPPLAALADYELRVVKLSYMAPVDRHLLLRIYNHIGEQLFTTSLPVGKSSVPHSYALDFAPYPNGTYLLVITQVEDNVDIADHRVEWALPG